MAGGEPVYVEMEPNTAVCLVLLAAALALLRPVANSRRRDLLGAGAAVAVATIALLTIGEDVLGVDLHIDQALFGEAPGMVARSHPGRMMPNAAVSLVLLAGAMGGLVPGARWREHGGQVLALGASALAGVALVGYLTGVSSLYADSQSTQVSIPTSVALLLLGSGICAARPRRGPMRLLTSDTVGGRVVRVLAPAAIAVPVVLGALWVVGEATGLFEAETGMWLLIVSLVLLLVSLSWALGTSLDRAERMRRGVQALSRAAQRDRVAFEEAPIASAIAGRDGRIERVNQAFCAMTGRAPDELVGAHFLDFTHPDDRTRSAEILADLLREASGPRQIEKRYVHRSGRVVEARVAITAILGEDAEVAQLFAQIDDVTEARRTSRELEQAQFEMLARLAAAAEFHDDDTSQHTRRVGEMSVAIGTRLGLPASEIDLIRLAAPLHDIGKIAIPDVLLAKPGKLTDAEFGVMKTHTTVGTQMLAGSAFALLGMAQQIALTHHERWDGGGYPAGLAGNAIPIAGRIVAVADVFDALTHARPYKPAWSVDAAIAEMAGQGGRQFDPEVLRAFLSLWRTPVAPA